MRSKKRMGLYFVFYVAAALLLLYVLALAGIGRILYVSMAGGTTIVQEKKEDASALPKYIEATDSKLDGFAIVEPIQKTEQLPQLLWLLHML